MKKYLVPISSAFIGGLLAVAVVKLDSTPEKIIVKEQIKEEQSGNSFTSFRPGSALPDLTVIAEKSLESVVHVHTVYQGQKYYGHPLFDLFYGRPQVMPAPEGTGSGVIISDDGYIVTNNHVIKGAQKVKITLHNKDVYDAKVIGRDPSTDLALLKVEGKDLPHMAYGNSDEIKVGEWVLAVGNPFNLNSTVTAGIISAKGRDINILNSDPESGISPVEAFIQTDAAVNPGNSGGALVNTRGELIGINAAIKSNTGSFMGYSFAIPANITKKVVRDLMEFGSVQRAFIGVSIRNVNQDLMEKEDLPSKDGVYIAGLSDKGSAKEGGLEVGDVITHVNDRPVNNVPELQEQVSNYRPGDKVSITYLRDGEIQQSELVLRNQFGNTEIIDNTDLMNSLAQLGAEMSPVSDKMKHRLGISYGVQVDDLEAGKFLKAGIRKGFIIRKVDGKKVNTPNDIASALSGKKGGVLFEGIYPNGKIAYYGVGM